MKRGYPYPRLRGLARIAEDWRRVHFWWGRTRPLKRMLRQRDKAFRRWWCS